jgi:ketosteroid isomerase-like protein
MSRENVEVVSRLYDAWNRRDPRCEAFYAVDAEFRDLQRAPGAPPVARGIKAVKQEWVTWLLLVGAVQAELEEYAEVDDWVVCITHWYANPAADSAQVDLRSVEAFEVRDGKIRRTVHGYESTARALKAVRSFSSTTPQPRGQEAVRVRSPGRARGRRQAVERRTRPSEHSTGARPTRRR